MAKIEKIIDVMLDVETLDNEGKFLVLSIAAVPFLMHTEIEPKNVSVFEERISIGDSIANGYKIGAETLKWWEKQDHQIFAKQMSGINSIAEVMDRLSNWVERVQISDTYTKVRWWATATLDYQAISNLSNTAGIKNPIVYNERLCARTVKRTAKLMGFIPKERTPLNDHSPVADCLNQISQLKEELTFFNVKTLF